MTTAMFLMLLSAFSVLTGLITEAIKKLLSEKENFSANFTALIVALIVGFLGTMTYYQLSAIPFTVNNIIYAALMGGASGLVAMVGYDKVSQMISQIITK